MRRIEFRGKTVADDEWVYGSLITNEDKFYIVNHPELSNEYGDGTDFYLTDFHEVKLVTVGEVLFKGDDKKKIYEKDIVECTQEIIKTGQIVRRTVHVEDIRYSAEELIQYDKLKVIGNSIDNEDLLPNAV
jgi:hypothetical protein